MHLTEELWRRLEPLFHTALDLCGPDREAFIERETADDRQLQLELRAMLRRSQDAGDRIAETVRRVAGQASDGRDWIGRSFGPYKILREIGRGGMGIVFEALRDDSEYNKRVALKVAPDWRDLAQLRERFRAERQILARLEHPNIARFLDGGTQDGVPYFAMEFIDGEPITEWVRKHNVSIRERIGLFRQICAAVTCVHENLVIHRDLKPANILVDKANTPKLLDFGIATILGQIVEQSTATTGIRLWTPDYASPEQVRGATITTRTDVYSLGLILYELLCGERAQVANPSSALALERSICETESVPPSARSRKSVSRQLQGDLDTIVAMAIRKEPERRYPSVAALDADLAAYLGGRPVGARPNTPVYRLSKFLRRHRLATAGAAILAFSVIAGIGSTLYQAKRAERRFQQLRSLANIFVFDVHDRIKDLPGSTEARKVIVSTALRYLENLRQDAADDPVLLRELAAAYDKIGDVQGNPQTSNLGDSQGALESYRRAEAILTPLVQRGDVDAKFELATSIYRLGGLQHVLGDAHGVEQVERARGLARELVAQRGSDFAMLELAGNISADLARFASDSRSQEKALLMAQEAESAAQAMVKLQPASVESLDFLALAETSLAAAYRVSGELERSAQAYRNTITAREQIVRDHPDNAGYRRLLLISYGHLGDALGPADANGLNQLPESVQAFEKAAEIAEWLSQRDPSDRKSWFDLVAAHMRTAASLLEEPNEAPRALLHIEKEGPYLTRLAKEDPSNQRYRLFQLVRECHTGKALAALGREREAAVRFEQALSMVEGFRGGQYEASARGWGINSSLRLGQIKAQMGDPAAITLANRTAEQLSNADPKMFAGKWVQASLYGRLGSLYLKLHQPIQAKRWLEMSVSTWLEMKVSPLLEPQRLVALAATERELKDPE